MIEYQKHISDQTNLISIVEYHSFGEKGSISGGPVIAYFYDNKLADDYIYYMTSKQPKPLNIVKFNTKNIKASNSDEYGRL